MFGFINKRKIEKEMAEWLSSPMEYGVAPSSIRYKRTYKGKLPGHANVMRVHLVEYAMPNGASGRGFVNSPLTWSFIGQHINPISDDHLFTAYCGWMGLFSRIQSGDILTDFVSDGEETRYLEQKQAQGYTDIEIMGRYKIAGSEYIELKANRQGTSIRIAGNTKTEIGFSMDQPPYYLPTIYFLFGQYAAQSFA